MQLMKQGVKVLNSIKFVILFVLLFYFLTGCNEQKSINFLIKGSWCFSNNYHDDVSIFFEDSVVHYLDGRKLGATYYLVDEDKKLIVFKYNLTSNDTFEIWKIKNINNEKLEVISLYDMKDEIYYKNNISSKGTTCKNKP